MVLKGVETISVSIRPFQENNCEFVLRLNKENCDVLIPMDDEELRFLCDNAELFDIAYVDDVPAGYIFALREGIEEHEYKSYKWFCENYSRFLYVDQVVIDEKYWGKGLGTCLYQKVFERANKTGVEIIAVAITADNEASLNFHAKMGFQNVGEQLIRGGTASIYQQIKEVSRADY